MFSFLWKKENEEELVPDELLMGCTYFFERHVTYKRYSKGELHRGLTIFVVNLIKHRRWKVEGERKALFKEIINQFVELYKDVRYSVELCVSMLRSPVGRFSLEDLEEELEPIFEGC